MVFKFKIFSVGVTIFIIGVFLGLLSYKENYWPRKILHSLKSSATYKENTSIGKPKIRVLPYSQGIPLYSDRLYETSLGSDYLDTDFVIQIPRHFDGNFSVVFNKQVTAYRFLSSKNDNSIFEDWEPTKIRPNVKGVNANLTSVVSKIIGPGCVNFQSGGPICSSPLLISDYNATIRKPSFKLQ